MSIEQDLARALELLEEATPGDLLVYDANEGDGWPPRPLWCFKNEAYDSGDECPMQGSIHYGGKEDADAITATVNFLRAHGPSLLSALADQRRYRFLRNLPEDCRDTDWLWSYSGESLDAAIEEELTRPCKGEI